MNASRSARALVASAALALAAACASAPLSGSAAQRFADREAIAGVLKQYMIGIDALDAELYAGAFAEDAEFSVAGTLYHGREEIAGIITGVIANRAQRLAEADASGGPPPNTLYHVMNNSHVELVDADTATHHAYYMTISQSADGEIRIGAIGRYEDELVKRDGEWLILRRVLTPNTPG